MSELSLIMELNYALPEDKQREIMQGLKPFNALIKWRDGNLFRDRYTHIFVDSEINNQRTKLMIDKIINE